MGWMDATFEEREVVERAASKWWIFLLTGIAWLIFALIVFAYEVWKLVLGYGAAMAEHEARLTGRMRAAGETPGSRDRDRHRPDTGGDGASP